MSDIPSPRPRTMEDAAAQLVGRELRPDEREMLFNLRDQYNYDDTDPLVVVLAMMGAYIIIAKDLPNKLIEASKQITETHSVVMGKAAMIVANDLVGHVVGLVNKAQRTRKDRWFDGLIGGGIGAVLVVLAATVWMYVLRR